MALAKFRTTLILVAVFAALLAFVWFFEKDREVKQEDELETYDILAVDRSMVKEIIFEQTDKKTKVVKGENGWQLTEPIKFKARASKIEETLDELGNLVANQRIESDSLGEFGLDKPAIKIVMVLTDGSSQELLIGDKNPQATSIYVKASSSNYIYLADTVIETQFKLDETVLKED